MAHLVVQYTNGYFEKGAWRWGRYVAPVKTESKIPTFGSISCQAGSVLRANDDGSGFKWEEVELKSLNMDDVYACKNHTHNTHFELEYLPTLIGGLIGGIIGFILVMLFVRFI